MSVRNGIVVAIDGPSGSGKSTISRRVAAARGLGYLDTGAMYRAAAWWCLHEGIDLADSPAVAATVAALPLQVGTDPAQPRVLVDGQDASVVIRSTEISTVVSAVATNVQVRPELIRRQRQIIEDAAAGGGIIAEGRDITTVVAPDADVRILLIADESARLARRAQEVHGRTDASALAATRDQVVRRDSDDATVAHFHEAADGVITVDSTNLTLEQTVRVVQELVEAARA
ncbi:MAG: (d)CMP kinase [Beutenbergiaceae bacterium]